MTMETRGFFENRRGRRLYFAAHGDAGAREAWVFCNPFLEEKVFSHPVYVAFARRLAGEGGFALRFDYEGDGDSEGEVSHLSLAEWGDDLADACAFARERFRAQSVSLFGLRLGAALAWLRADEVRAERLLLWDPMVNGAAYFQECLRLNLTTQLATYKKIVENREQMMQRLEGGETVNIAGYEVGGRMASSIAAMDIGEPDTAPASPARVLQFLKPGAGVNRVASPMANHSNVHVEPVSIQPFWQESKHHDPAPERLIEASLRVVASRPGARAGGAG